MRVLVVDDDSVLCHWLGAKLHSHGYACNIVHDGEHALKAIKDEIYDVVLLDRMLPTLDGFSVLRELKGSRHPPNHAAFGVGSRCGSRDGAGTGCRRLSG